MAVVDIDVDAGEETVDEITARGSNAAFVDADVTREEDVRRMIATTVDRFAGLDILVNNAGGYDSPVFPDAPIEHWSRNFDLNVRSVMLGIHFAVPVMEELGGGLIVNVASSAGLGVPPHPGPEYAGAKAAVVRLTAALASLRERGIRVNCVCPHTVGTPEVRRRIAIFEAEKRELPGPLRDVLLEPDELVDAVNRFVEDDSLAGRIIVLIGGKAPELLAVD